MSSGCSRWCAGDAMNIGAVLIVLYLWLKAGHVIFVIFWIAGLFMLPRFYVYHQESRAGLGRGEEVDRARDASCARSSSPRR